MNSQLQEKLDTLPTNSGVYMFKNKRGQVIYIGKALSLRSRVRSYFQSRGAQDTKTQVLVSKIHDLELFITDSEMEAMILEANLVKQHKPRYNIHLKDDKRYPYVKVTVDEPFPRVMVVRRIEKDGARYFGPYTHAHSMRRTLKLLCTLFKIRTCNLVIPHPQGKPYKVCLDYHIGRCLGPCEALQTQESYRESVNSVLMFLAGKGGQLLEDLESKMKSAAERAEFERAAEVRDQINDLKTVVERQKVDVAEKVDRDIIAFAMEAGEAVAVILQVRDGILIGRQDFPIKPGDLESHSEVVREFVTQYYNNQPNIPRELYLPIEIEDNDLIELWLSDKAGSKVIVRTPQRGEKVRLVEMAAANANLLLGELLVQKRGYRERIAPMVKELQKALSLENPPTTIACFDISNTGKTDAVGSMSFFKAGKPFKNEYRRFKIKTVAGQDDYAMMREIIGRYFFRRLDENLTLPDLVVIDGGRGQLNAAVAELKSLNVTAQPIIGLAKRLEEIYFPDRAEPITLRKDSPALALLKQVRDEAHRFGVDYNRNVRARRTIMSKLDSIAGVGPSRREALLKSFGSVKKIGAASVDEIAATPGITRKLAEVIKRELRAV